MRKRCYLDKVKSATNRRVDLCENNKHHGSNVEQEELNELVVLAEF